jgi:uncharacterized protein YjaZ
MKNAHRYIILIVLFAIFSGCKTTFKTSKSFKLIFEDTNNFWKMYDKVKLIENDENRIEIIENDYLKKATLGLKLLIKKDKLTAISYNKQLKDTVFYNSIRQTTINIQSDSVKIRNYTSQFEKLYPQAVFSDIYFVVGQFKHGGTVIKGNTIIEIQKNAKTETTKSEFLRLDNLIDYNSFISLIIHEQVHINQKKGVRFYLSNNLLTNTLSEGSADFIMFLITKQLPSYIRKTYVYGNEHEYELWLKFKKDLKNDYKKIRNDWLYNPNRKNIPPDLGYFIGFKICEKYYNESSDKIKAIEFILNGNNYSKMIEKSHYNGGK